VSGWRLRAAGAREIVRPRRLVGRFGRPPLNFTVGRARDVPARFDAAVTPTAFRKLALSLPEACESSHVGHPDFRVRKRIFATLNYPNAAWGMVKLTPAEQELFVRSHPLVFKPVRGGWGLKGATSVKLRTATIPILRPALMAAWKNAAPPSLVARHTTAGTR
jgi:hypothetical protein